METRKKRTDTLAAKGTPEGLILTVCRIAVLEKQKMDMAAQTEFQGEFPGCCGP